MPKYQSQLLAQYRCSHYLFIIHINSSPPKPSTPLSYIFGLSLLRHSLYQTRHRSQSLHHYWMFRLWPWFLHLQGGVHFHCQLSSFAFCCDHFEYRCLCLSNRSSLGRAGRYCDQGWSSSGPLLEGAWCLDGRALIRNLTTVVSLSLMEAPMIYGQMLFLY